MTEEELKELNEKFPFLTVGEYLNQEYIGIVQNEDEQIVVLYAYNCIIETDLKAFFLECGETWWWESNRKIPVNLFLGEKFKIFKPFLKRLIKKEFKHKIGPTVCLDDLMEKRVKRRSVTLIRKM